MAPEVKAAPDTVTAAFAEFMTAFEAFKEANDERLGEIEEKLTSDVVTRDKVERINKAIDEQSRLLDELVLKKRRPALERPGRDEAGLAEHKAAFEAYVRRGDDQALRDLDQKALSAGVSGDGGYLVPPQVDEEIGRRLRVISPIRSLATVRQVSGAVLKKPFAASGFASAGWRRRRRARRRARRNFPNSLSRPWSSMPCRQRHKACSMMPPSTSRPGLPPKSTSPLPNRRARPSCRVTAC